MEISGSTKIGTISESQADETMSGFMGVETPEGLFTAFEPAPDLAPSPGTTDGLGARGGGRYGARTATMPPPLPRRFQDLRTVVGTFGLTRDNDYRTPGEIVRAQEKLVALGISVGHSGRRRDGVDGRLGPSTREAIRRFQQGQMRRGTYEPDRLDDATYRAILRAEIPSAPAAAPQESQLASEPPTGPDGKVGLQETFAADGQAGRDRWDRLLRLAFPSNPRDTSVYRERLFGGEMYETMMAGGGFGPEDARFARDYQAYRNDLVAVASELRGAPSPEEQTSLDRRRGDLETRWQGLVDRNPTLAAIFSRGPTAILGIAGMDRLLRESLEKARISPDLALRLRSCTTVAEFQKASLDAFIEGAGTAYFGQLDARLREAAATTHPTTFQSQLDELQGTARLAGRM